MCFILRNIYLSENKEENKAEVKKKKVTNLNRDYDSSQQMFNDIFFQGCF